MQYSNISRNKIREKKNLKTYEEKIFPPTSGSKQLADDNSNSATSLARIFFALG